MTGTSCQSKPAKRQYRERTRNGHRIPCIFSDECPSPFTTSRSCHGQGFEKISHLRDYLTRCHPEKKLHMCLSCFECFETEISLGNHKKPRAHKASRRARGAVNKEQEILEQYQAIYKFYKPCADLPLSPYSLSPAMRLRNDFSVAVEELRRRYKLNDSQVEATKQFVSQFFGKSIDMYDPMNNLNAHELPFVSDSTDTDGTTASSQISYSSSAYSPAEPALPLESMGSEYIDPHLLSLHSQDVTHGYHGFRHEA